MDKKTTITVGRSVQVFQIGMPEYWNKVTISKDFPEDVNVQLAIDDLMLEVEKAHGKHSVSEDASTFDFTPKKQSVKLKPDMEMRKRYAFAVADNDQLEVIRLESIYDFKIG